MGNTKAEATHHDSTIMDEKAGEELREVQTASEALEAALAAEKPKPWGAGMIRLYFIMGIGYLVSTMNGFGMLCSLPSLRCVSFHGALNNVWGKGGALT